MKIDVKKKQPINRTKEQPFGIQHDPLDYISPEYLDPHRMSSYGYQYQLALKTGKESYLNIGNANELISGLLQKQNKTVTNLDIDPRTHPHVNGLLPYLPFKEKTFDTALCFQILEHLPYSLLPTCLRELVRVTNFFIILSLPDISLSKREIFKYSIYKAFHHPKEWRVYEPKSVNVEHFWEIGDGFVQLGSLLNLFDKENLRLKKHFRNFLFPYHHFFYIEVK